MSRRKPPVTTKAQREQMADDWVKLREKIGDRMREAHEAHMYAYGALLNLELLFGQPPTPPESLNAGGASAITGNADWRAAVQNIAKSVLPPAPAWRSMASAPNPGVDHLAALWIDKEVVIKVGSVYTTKHWRSESGDGYSLSDVLAWAPIPEWTGEVAE